MSSDTPFMEGDIEFDVEGAGKPCKTHYKIFGSFPSPTSTPPLIVLHGGPGIPHNYMLPLRHLSTHFPIIFYDQLGCGLSTRLPHLTGELGTAFWTPQLFLDELSNLITHLKIDNYNIIGNSWGGMLAGLHSTLSPPGLKTAIICNSPASIHLWMEAAKKLRSQLPPEVQEVLDRCEREGKTESKEYEEASRVFYERHVCRAVPWDADLVESFRLVGEDNTVYLSMNGPNEFNITGSLKSWTIIPDLHKIKVPTLLINGRYDEATDDTVEPFFKGIEKVKWVRFAESSHLPQFEEPEEYLRVVREFLE